MSAQTQVPKLYKSVIEDVINNVREAFMDEGIDESVLSELKNIWESKLKASKVMESDSTPAASLNDPMLSGPYIALQQQHNAGTNRAPGYQAEKQHHQTITRTPAVPASSVPMFTTMTNPVTELSDAASMAYSSILQSQQALQQPGKGAGTSAGAAGGSRAQMVAAAAAAQPQYLLTSPNSVSPVIIPHSQAVRLQQQQQQQHQQGRGGQSGMRGSVPQVDGALDERAVTEEVEEEEEDECPALDPNFCLSSLKRSIILSSETDETSLRQDSASSPISSLSRTVVQASSTIDSANRQTHSSKSNASALGNTDQATTTTTASPTDIAGATTTSSCFPDSAAAAAAALTEPSSVATQFSYSSFSSSAELCLSNGESLRGKIIKKNTGKKRSVASGGDLGRPKRGDKIEIVFQVDGNHSSSDDDDDDDDDADVNEDDSSDRDPDDEDIPGVEDEPLNSEDDVSDNDPEELFDTENVVVCQYEKISRVRNKWRFYLKDGIMNIQGRDYVFLKASGEAEW